MNLTKARARLLCGAALGLGLVMLSAQPAKADSACSFGTPSSLPTPSVAFDCTSANGNGRSEGSVVTTGTVGIPTALAVIDYLSGTWNQGVTTGYIESTTAGRGVIRFNSSTAFTYTGTGSTLVTQSTATGAITLSITATSATLLSGTVTALGANSNALVVTANGGAGSGSINATIDGNIRADGGNAIVLVQSNAAATGNVTLTSNAGTTIRSSGGAGILTISSAAAGNLSITNNSAISSGGAGANTLLYGIQAFYSGTGNVQIANNGAIGSATDRAQALGIYSGQLNAASAGTTSVTGSGAIFSVDDAIFARNLGSGAVSVNYTGALDATTGNGIDALTTGGNLTISAGAVTSAGAAAILAAQSSSAGSGAISVTTTGAVSGTTGIRANNTGTGGTTITTGAGLVTGTAGIGIHADITNPAATGNLAVNVGAGGVTSNTTGVLAQNFGTGTLAVTTGGAVTSTGGVGIQAITGGGSQTITSGGATTGTTNGIQASSTTGNIAVNVTGGTVTGAVNGISATSTSGTVAVNVSGGNVIGSAANANGVFVQSSGAMTVTIGAGRSVTAPGTNGFAILTGGTGTVLVNNSGTFGTAGSVALFNGGFTNANTVNNLAGGTMNGRVDLGDLVDIINNTGTWNATGVNNFYLGADVVTNNAGGIINTATATTFAGLETYTNAGTTNTTGTLGFTGVATALTNSGTFNLGAASAVSGLGVVTSSGAINAAAGSSLSNTGNFTNSGTLTTAGAFGLASTGTFLNSGALVLAPAVFTLTGATAFNSSGTIRAEGGATTITSALALNNTGSIDLQDGATGDFLTITGNYNAGTGASLLMDYGGTAADRLLIGGNVTGGTTSIVFTATPGITGIDTSGLLVVDVTGTAAASAFTTASVLNGLINLTLEQRGVDFYLLAVPNQGAFVPVTLGNIVQESWFQGQNAFSDMLVGRGEMRNARGFALWLQPYYSNDKSGDRNLTFTTLGQTYTIPARLDTERWGIQGGADYFVGGADIGITGGYQSANAHNSVQDLTGWNVGAYALIGSGMGWYANALVKYDSDEVDTGLGLDTDADSLGGDLEVGYRLQGADVATLDLTAGFSYVDSSVDDFSLLGISYETDSVTSARGRIGIRAVFPEMSGMFVGAHVFHEFEGDTELVLNSTSDAVVTNEARSTWGRIELGVGADALSPINVQAWMDLGDVKGWGLTAGARF